MKITVTRTYEPVTREIEGCLECPWVHREQDMNTTIMVCQHPKFNNDTNAPSNAYSSVIPDISSWGRSIFSKHCPLLK